MRYFDRRPRFFQHSGINYMRLAEAVLADLRSGHQGQGGSTITMQISRGFFLSPQKTLKRKLIEMLIAIELEQKLTKQQIFELYANQVEWASADRSRFMDSPRRHAHISIRICRASRCRKLRCWPESYSGRAT